MQHVLDADKLLASVKSKHWVGRGSVGAHMGSSLLTQASSIRTSVGDVILRTIPSPSSDL